MFPTFALDVRDRWVRNSPFLVAGSGGIVGGGFAAAVAGAVDWGHGAWTAAFAVLVVGVAQVILGVVQAALAPVLLPRAAELTEFALWNLGCAGVIAGTQMDSTLIVALGSTVFLGALGIAGWAVRSASDLTGTPKVLLQIYRVLLVVWLISVLIGIILSLAGS